MSKFVLDGVTFDVGVASVSKVDGVWFVNTKSNDVAPTLKDKPTIDKEKRREYQRRYQAKKKQNLGSLEIPVFNSKYQSTEVKKLQYGSVAKQVRDQFKNVNEVAIVKAHSKKSIYSAFSLQGWKVRVLNTVDNNSWKVVRVQ